MSSGRRETVLIFCVSAMKDLYVSPIDHYNPDRVFVFLNDGNDALSKFERKTYDGIKDGLDFGEITECVLNTHDYEAVLSRLIDIKKKLTREFGKDLDIFINITSGTHEFAAAGMFAAMLTESAIAFKVEAENSDLTEEDIAEIVDSVEGKLNLGEPVRASILKDKTPSDEMVEFLRVVQEQLEITRHPKFATIIDELKKRDLWTYDPNRKSGGGRTTLKQKEEMYLKRHYLSVALENGWITRSDTNMMKITEKGLAYLQVFSTADADYMDIGPEFGRRVCCNSSALFEEYDEPEENIIAFEHDGRKYRLRVGLE